MEGRLAADISAERVAAFLMDHAAVVQGMHGLASNMADAAELLADAVYAGGKILLCGNGGSATSAQHIAAEFVARFRRERQAFPALALNADGAVLTAIGNDCGFDQIFARQVTSLGNRGDVLIAVSTSGSSANVVAAVQAARGRGLRTIGLSGAIGGELLGLCDLCICVPSSSPARIQEMHILTGHVLCELIGEAVC